MCDNCSNCPNCCSQYEAPAYLEPGRIYQFVENKVKKGDVFMVGYNQVGDPVVHYTDNEFMQCFAVNVSMLKRI